MATPTPMLEVVDWAKTHGTISYESETLVCGRYGDFAFRIFPTTGWAGVVYLDEKRWKESFACYSLFDFLGIVKSKDDS